MNLIHEQKVSIWHTTNTQVNVSYNNDNGIRKITILTHKRKTLFLRVLLDISILNTRYSMHIEYIKFFKHKEY